LSRQEGRAAVKVRDRAIKAEIGKNEPVFRLAEE
jgi:hypothetical protein